MGNSTLLPARLFDESDRILLLREDRSESEGNFWYVCHPSDGLPHGTKNTDYAEFPTEEIARQTATALGWKIITD